MRMKDCDQIRVFYSSGRLAFSSGFHETLLGIIIIRGQHTDSKDHLGGGAEEPTVAPRLLTQS